MTHQFISQVLLVITIAVVAGMWWILPLRTERFYRWIGPLVLLALSVEFIGYITAQLGVHNGILYNLFITLEALLIVAMASEILPVRFRFWLLAAALIPLAALITFSLQKGTVQVLHREIVLLNSLMLFPVILAVLWHLAQHSTLALTRIPAFWIFLGTLVYFGGIIPMIGLDGLLKSHNPVLGSLLYRIVPSLAIIRYLLAAWGLQLARNDRMEQAR
jgi:hypothetical protein